MKIKTTILILLCFLFTPFLTLAEGSSAISYSFTWPLDKWIFDMEGQKFGTIRGSGIYHLGDDIGIQANSPVYAIATGVVKNIGVYTDFGTVILIEHTLANQEKIVSLYGHLGRDTQVEKGQFVNKNQIIGYIGTTDVNGGWPEHLHFGIRKGAYVTNWVYWGLGSKDKLNDWHNPTDFLWYKINNPDVNSGKIVTSPNYPGRSHIRIFDEQGLAIPTFDFFAYPPKNKQGSQISLGDINNDQKQELIISSNSYKPQIKIFNKNSQDFIAKFKPFSKKYNGQINLATTDLNLDGQDEIIATSSSNQYPKIKIFSLSAEVPQDEGGLYKTTNTFIELTKIPSPFSHKIKCGINLTTIDLNNDGKKEILATPANNKKSVLKYWDGTTWQILKSRIFKKTTAKLTTGDIDADGNEEIIAGSQSNTRSVIKIINKNGHIRKKKIKPFARYNQDGINISTVDYNNDGITEIITSIAKNGSPRIKVFQYPQNIAIANFLAYNENFTGGVNIVGIK
ncbi:MAG: FG-GAP-like repeat-containing protein [Patescibacteria group bacterium]|jgi:hypothetical protein